MRKRDKKFERFHRHSLIQYGLSFDFTTPSPDARFGITLIGPVDDEKRSYEFNFYPPLEKIHAGSSYLSVMHIESKRRDTIITILPKTEDKKFQDPFFVFTTHVVRSNLSHITKLYLTIVNNQLRGDIATPIWNPHFNMEWFIRSVIPNEYHSLDFFDPEQSMDSVDVSKIPQGSYIAGKSSYGLTASRSGKLLGFYPGTSDFSGWRAVSMRIGRLYEPLIAIMYLKNHSDYKFYEIGFTSVENGNGIDGCQVDGKINCSAIDFAAEFKCSKFNCDFEATYISQCVIEMACGFPFIDLVKFSERQVKQANTNIWMTKYECKEIRLYRNPELEKEILNLCHHSASLKGPKFDAVIQTEPYIEIRNKLENLARECNEKAKQVPVDLKIIEQFKQYKQNVLNVQSDDSILLDPTLDRIEKRQCRIFSLIQEENQDEFVKETIEQMEDYCELLKKKK